MGVLDAVLNVMVLVDEFGLTRKKAEEAGYNAAKADPQNISRYNSPYSDDDYNKAYNRGVKKYSDKALKQELHEKSVALKKKLQKENELNLERYSLTCNKCGMLAKPISGTERNYECKVCSRRFSATKHPC